MIENANVVRVTIDCGFPVPATITQG